ncbi:hypothetical protein QJS66_08545 [Kocuria rhizophila]|nr:hypothetical protein QJS66_08545 [Kocuria rhizophila]
MPRHAPSAWPDNAAAHRGGARRRRGLRGARPSRASPPSRPAARRPRTPRPATTTPARSPPRTGRHRAAVDWPSTPPHDVTREVRTGRSRPRISRRTPRPAQQALGPSDRTCAATRHRVPSAPRNKSSTLAAPTPALVQRAPGGPGRRGHADRVPAAPDRQDLPGPAGADLRAAGEASPTRSSASRSSSARSSSGGRTLRGAAGPERCPT